MSAPAAGKATYAITVNALGVPVRIETDEPRLVHDLEQAWEWCLLDPSTTPSATVSVTDALTESTLEAVMEQLTQLVTIAAVQRRAGDLVMLHACVIADPDTGAAAVLVGPSGTGKTTLAATLGTRWAYLSDETAGITNSGDVVAYPKPLSVVAEHHLGKDQVSPAALSLQSYRGHATVKAVVLLHRDPTAAETDIGAVPMVPAITMLAEHTSYLADLERPLHRLADVLAATGGLHLVTYAEAADLIPVVARLLQEAR